MIPMKHGWFRRLDTGDATATPTNLPMQAIPPILKLAGNKDAILRFVYSGSGLPTDRETVYWINVQEIRLRRNKKTYCRLRSVPA